MIAYGQPAHDGKHGNFRYNLAMSPSTQHLPQNEAVRLALETDLTIDIVTIGARTGQPRRTEIWFWNIDGRIIICGTPSAGGDQGPRARRDWLANLRANPEFLFCLKESIRAELPARAVIITDPADRWAIMSDPQTRWYRQQGFSLEELVAGSPMVEVFFLSAER
jgi:hypothetical protein